MDPGIDPALLGWIRGFIRPEFARTAGPERFAASW